MLLISESQLLAHQIRLLAESTNFSIEERKKEFQAMIEKHIAHSLHHQYKRGFDDAHSLDKFIHGEKKTA